MYQPPLSLTILSGIFLAFGAICGLLIAFDIVMRRGWRSMMAVMIVVWPVTATYLGPLSIFLYYTYGRPSKPERHLDAKVHASPQRTSSENLDLEKEVHDEKKDAIQPKSHCCHSAQPVQPAQPAPEAKHSHCHDTEAASKRPMWATTLIGVSHCGAGCVLGDIVGEWLVYGAGVTINGQGIWAELLIDYGFALLFGIAFQYFSIAPMSGEWGIRSVWRAAQADVLSLTSFQVGLFGWMVAFQVGIFEYRLETPTWTYWWLMQVGMIIGTATAFPVNWFLIKYKVKEPCV